MAAHGISKHDEWRRNAAAATLRVVARDGVEAASMRGIASEMGCTTGALTHYFPDKAALMRQALDLVMTSVAANLDRLSSVDATVDDLCEVLQAVVNGEAGADISWRAWLAITAASTPGDDLLQEQGRRYRRFRKVLAECLARLASDGALKGVTDAESEAAYLVAFVDGLGVQGMIDPKSFGPRRRADLVRSCIDRLK